MTAWRAFPGALLALAIALPAQPARQAATAAELPAGTAELGAALAAKRVASAVFVAGRDADAVLAAELAPETEIDALLRPLLRIEVDRGAGTVTARVLGAERVAVHRPGLGCTLALGTTARELMAKATLPRAADDEPAKAAIPWPRGDAPPSARQADGVDHDALDAAVARAFDEPERGPRRRTRAVVVVHRGRLVAERYADGFGPGTPLEGWSMAKSLTHALVGIRVRDGALAVDEPVRLEAWSTPQDPRRAVTLDHLLTMTSGLAWDESYTDPSSDPAQMLFAAPDVPRYAASKPLAAAPGSRWSYSSGTTNVICRLVRDSFDDEASHLGFARRELFEPLGMRSAIIEVDPGGTLVGSSFAWATARDWARFGLLYLRDGRWDGKRILPEGWVASAREPTPGSRGRYGRHWWLNAGDPTAPQHRPFPTLPADMFYASGFEGQIVALLPTQDLVVVRLGCTKVSRAFDMESFLHAVLAAVQD